MASQKKQVDPKPHSVAGHGTKSGSMTPERLEAVRQLITMLWPHGKIEHALAKEWGVSTVTIHSYIKRVYETMRIDSEEYKASRRDRMRATLEEHYQRCIKAGKFAPANMAIERLCRIDGLLTDRVEVVGKDGGPIEISVDEAVESLARSVAEIVAARK